jgi:hypothetical protein
MPKEDIGPIPREEVELSLMRLKPFVAALEQFNDWFEKHPKEADLWVWRYKSLNRGLEALEGLPREFTRAIHAFSKGQPQGPHSSKKRKPPESAEEGEQIYQAKEAALNEKKAVKKKATKKATRKKAN